MDAPLTGSGCTHELAEITRAAVTTGPRVDTSRPEGPASVNDVSLIKKFFVR
jgi:hypothetical protein